MKVNEEAKEYRKRVLEHIELLASPSDQMTLSPKE
jgi:hypothetical protein